MAPGYVDERSMDTVIILFDKDGKEISYDDDDSEGYASSLTFQAEYNGVYYVKVVNYYFWVGDGPDEWSEWNGPGSYDISVTDVESPALAAPLKASPIEKKANRKS